MNFWYTANKKFNHLHHQGLEWEKYIEWSKLTHLTELVSLDSMLCRLAFEVNYQDEKTYENLIVDDGYSTDMFNCLDFVLEKITEKDSVNILAVVKQPKQSCETILLENFIFLGYDLLDKDYQASALSNCGGFDETFLPHDLNQYGLLTDFSTAVSIQENLKRNNPEERHADCNLFAIWRQA